ncbi:MAG: serine protease [Pseudomonadota bacterium]
MPSKALSIVSALAAITPLNVLGQEASNAPRFILGEETISTLTSDSVTASDRFVDYSTAYTSSGIKVVHGEDGRMDTCEVGTGVLADYVNHVANNTVLITDADKLSKDGDFYNLALRPYEIIGVEPCAGERFSDQKLGGDCTGFMISADVLVTAHHCLELFWHITDKAFVRNFEFDCNNSLTKSRFPKEDVVLGSEARILASDSFRDFSIVKLPIPFGVDGGVSIYPKTDSATGENVGIVGHPVGLPMKWAASDEDLVIAEDDLNAFTNVDAFMANSGSPIFLQDTGTLFGILIGGDKDWNHAIEDGNLCFKSATSVLEDGSEQVLKASAIHDILELAVQ